jgi:hypothetical protein
MKHVLLKDIVIPKGTVFKPAPKRVDYISPHHVAAEIGLSKNTSGTVVYYIGDDGPEMQGWFGEMK